MRIVFMGTPLFAVPSLSRLLGDGHDVAAVVTRPDKPRGRGRQMAPSPVKVLAVEKKLNVLQPAKVNDNEPLQAIAALDPELIIVVAFGAILRKPLLELPSVGCINVHASLLPELRGAAPANWAIIRGQKETGVTTMWMAEKLDAGDIIFQSRVPIHDEETASELEGRLAAAGSELLSSTLKAVEKGEAPRIPQDDSLSTYAPALKKEDGVIDWGLDAAALCNHIRGVTLWPGAQTTFRGEPLKFLKARVFETEGVHEPASVLRVNQDGSLAVGTGRGSVLVVTIQPSGKKAMSAVDFARGRQLRAGQSFGT
ncbi:MAG: methionyl-tRNA formyltransferase [Candidatus Eiseniibacteriota bacterium]|nr:MAG: methionyl-tRNA formyltransferase [Candidatus Eisenbacteria bacterium]